MVVDMSNAARRAAKPRIMIGKEEEVANAIVRRQGCDFRVSGPFFVVRRVRIHACY